MNRFLLLTLTLFSCLINVRAQYENTTWMQRMGHGKDSVMNMESQMQWSAYLNANKDTAVLEDQTWDDKAYRAWHRLITKAPYSQFSLYASGGAGDMLRYLIRKEPDRAVKLIYFQDLMEMCELRIKNLDAINSIPDFGPDKKSTLGDVKTWKAYYYFTTGKEVPLYSAEKAYDYFVDAMKTVREMKSVEGTEVKGYLLWNYYSACKELYLSDNDKYMEQFLQDYIDCTETCNKMTKFGYDSPDTVAGKEIIKEYYNNTYLPIVHDFSKVGVGKKQNLYKYYSSRFEANKDNAAFLEQAIRLMAESSSLDSSACEEFDDMYYKFCRTSYRIKPSYQNCIGYARECEKNDLREDMRDCYKKAVELADNDEQRALICYRIAKSLRTRKPSEKDSIYSGGENDPMFKEDFDKWTKNTNAALNFYEELVKKYKNTLVNSNNLALNRILVDCYWDMGTIHVLLVTTAPKLIAHLKYIEEYTNLAVKTDPVYVNASMAGALAKRRSNIAQYHTAIAKYEHNKAAYAKAKAEHDAYEAKKKAEADFWAGK